MNLAQGTPYPNNCLRGVFNKSAVRTDGRPETEVFNQWQLDGGEFVQSINWEDDDGAIPFTLAQTRRDLETLQFPGGVAVLARIEIDNMMKWPANMGVLSYERAPEDGNRYHGNLRLGPGVTKPHRTQIAGALALAVSSVIQR